MMLASFYRSLFKPSVYFMAALFLSSHCSAGEPRERESESLPSRFNQLIAYYLRSARQDDATRDAGHAERADSAERRHRERQQQLEHDLKQLRSFAARNAAERDAAVAEIRRRVEAWADAETERARQDHRNNHAAHRDRVEARIREGRKMGEAMVAAIVGGAGGGASAGSAGGGTGTEGMLINVAGRAIGRALRGTDHDDAPKVDRSTALTTKPGSRVVLVPEGLADMPIAPADLPLGVLLGPSVRRAASNDQTTASNNSTRNNGKIASYPWDGSTTHYLESLPHRSPSAPASSSSIQKPSVVLRTPTDPQAVTISRIAGFAPERLDPETVGSTDDGWTRAQRVDANGNSTTIYTKPTWFGLSRFRTSSGAAVESGWQSPIGNGQVRAEGTTDHRGRNGEVKMAAGGSATGGIAVDTWGVVLPNGAGLSLGRRASVGRASAEASAGSDGVKGSLGVFGPEAQFEVSIFGRPSRTATGAVKQPQFTVGVGGTSGAGIEGRLTTKGVKGKVAVGAGPSVTIEGGSVTGD